MTTSNSQESQLYPEELDTDPTLPSGKPAIVPAPFEAVLARESEHQVICPNCGTKHMAGELACSGCGVLFTNGGKTNKLDTREKTLPPSGKAPIGEVFAEENTLIFLEIAGQRIELPKQKVIVIGRSSDAPGSPQPDVALNNFGAAEEGVSRHHARITRHANIFYIADMGSSNGTFLNGHPLLRNHNRILRSGDELQLGFLKLHVRF